MKPLTIQLSITVGALVIALIHVIWRTTYVDSIVVALFAIAVVPWLEPLFKKIKIGSWEIEFRELRSDVNAIQFALRGIVTRHELEHLKALRDPGAYPVSFGSPLWRELERLDAIGFISPTAQANGRLDTIRNKFGDETIPVEKREQFNLKDYVQITSAAREYLTLLVAK